jgi:hypothetical protein
LGKNARSVTTCQPFDYIFFYPSYLWMLRVARPEAGEEREAFFDLRGIYENRQFE